MWGQSRTLLPALHAGSSVHGTLSGWSRMWAACSTHSSQSRVDAMCSAVPDQPKQVLNLTGIIWEASSGRCFVGPPHTGSSAHSGSPTIPAPVGMGTVLHATSVPDQLEQNHIPVAAQFDQSRHFGCWIQHVGGQARKGPYSACWVGSMPLFQPMDWTLVTHLACEAIYVWHPYSTCSNTLQISLMLFIVFRSHNNNIQIALYFWNAL